MYEPFLIYIYIYKPKILYKKYIIIFELIPKLYKNGLLNYRTSIKMVEISAIEEYIKY